MLGDYGGRSVSRVVSGKGQSSDGSRLLKGLYLEVVVLGARGARGQKRLSIHVTIAVYS
jgi:hypothetical protein